MRVLLLVLSILSAGLGPVRAVEPGEILADPALEARARALSAELRCLVCQNEPIDSSNADLARDLRILVRERLTAGDSDAQVKSYLVARYGDFILFDPPLKPATYLLWYGPLLIVLLGVGGVMAYFARRGRTPGGTAPLSAEERRRLESVLAADDPFEPGPP